MEKGVRTAATRESAGKKIGLDIAVKRRALEDDQERRREEQEEEEGADETEEPDEPQQLADLIKEQARDQRENEQQCRPRRK